MDSNTKRNIILNNYQNPQNRKRHDNDKNYIKINSRNISCIDNIDLYIKINNNIITDISFEGEACAITISSTSILTNLVKGKTIDEALNIINNYNNMIEGKEYNQEKLQDAIVYAEISKQPSRKTCATLTWNGLYNKLLPLKK